jgi:CRP/FNR family transcriptional regulator
MGAAIQVSCMRCEPRPHRVFCDLPAEALGTLDGIKTVTAYQRGAALFSEGRQARGVFVLCGGRAKLSICGDSGKRLLLRIASPGEVLGLSSALSGRPYELTAEALDSCQVAFVRRRDLLKFLRAHCEACLRVVHLLSGDLHNAYERVRTIGLSRTRRPRAQTRSAKA